MIFKIQKKIIIHFIGIGGIGMSGIAEVLLQMGHTVTGSDISESANVIRLKKLGAKISIGHKAENLSDATLVVYSSAVTESNEEYSEAKKNKIPIMRRAEMLAELMRLKQGVAIAGTHGKTTTTSFLATILWGAKFDPTYIIGGIVKNLDGHARVGKGDFIIAEADESDGSFLLLNPIVSVITNIDKDHLNFYKTEENLFKCFEEFANKVPFYGCCALNAHDETVMKLTKTMRKPWITFGIEGVENERKVNFLAKNLVESGNLSTFDLFHNGKLKVQINVKIPGRHNVLNALGAIAMAYNLGVSFESIADSIQEFEGVGRRLQTVFTTKKLEVIDDYAHHPTAIATTLETIKKSRKNKVVVLFQPHRYSRTEECWKEFLHCFNSANEVHIIPIYPASEKPIKGISAERLVQDINQLHPGLASFLSDSSEFITRLKKIKSSDENITLLSMGAGSIGKKMMEMVDNVFKS